MHSNLGHRAGAAHTPAMPSPDALRAAVRDVVDFPKPGIVFKDITPILANGPLFRDAITLLCNPAADQRIDKIVGIDARGFIFAAAVADRLGVGFVPIRKKGKLPWKTRQTSYSLEYGESVVELHEDAVIPGERVMLVDDLLATGGTAAAALQLLTELGAEIVSVSFLIELSFLHGRDKLGSHPIRSILSY
nr:adenine phosphoribosyltransferase [Luteolibacter ambystomatis]